MALLIVCAASLAINAAIARYHAYLFDVKQRRIDHIFWSGIWLALNALVVGTIYNAGPVNNIMCLISLANLRLPTFNILLNYFRKPRKPILYINTSDKSGSQIDLLIKKWYPAILVLCLCIFLTLQLILWQK